MHPEELADLGWGWGAGNADGLKIETAAYMGNSALEKLEQSCQLAHLLDRTTNVGLKHFWLGFIALTSHSQEPDDAR